MGDRHDSRVANGEGRIGERIYQLKGMARKINRSPFGRALFGYEARIAVQTPRHRLRLLP